MRVNLNSVTRASRPVSSTHRIASAERVNENTKIIWPLKLGGGTYGQPSSLQKLLKAGGFHGLMTPGIRYLNQKQDKQLDVYQHYLRAVNTAYAMLSSFVPQEIFFTRESVGTNDRAEIEKVPFFVLAFKFFQENGFLVDVKDRKDRNDYQRRFQKLADEYVLSEYLTYALHPKDFNASQVTRMNTGLRQLAQKHPEYQPLIDAYFEILEKKASNNDKDNRGYLERLYFSKSYHPDGLSPEAASLWRVWTESVQVAGNLLISN